MFDLWRVGALGYDELLRFHDRSRINYTVSLNLDNAADAEAALRASVAQLVEVEWTMPPSRHVSLLTRDMK